MSGAVYATAGSCRSCALLGAVWGPHLLRLTPRSAGSVRGPRGRRAQPLAGCRQRNPVLGGSRRWAQIGPKFKKDD